MKPVLKTLVVVLAIGLMVSDAFAILGVRRRTRRRTAVVVGSASRASTAAAQQQTAAAQQQAAAAEAEAAAAKQQAAAAEAEAAAEKKEAEAAKQQAAAAQAKAAQAATGPLPLGSVLPSLPAGCTQKAVGGVAYYVGGGNYFRAVFQGTSLVYVTVAVPK